jgi:hypothetical protein
MVILEKQECKMGQMKSLFMNFLEKYDACTTEELQDELALYDSLQSSGVSDEIRKSFLEQLLEQRNQEETL